MNRQMTGILLCVVGAGLWGWQTAEALTLTSNPTIAASGGTLPGATGEVINVQTTDMRTFSWADKSGGGTMNAASPNLNMAGYTITKADTNGIVLDLNGGSISNGAKISTSAGTTFNGIYLPIIIRNAGSIQITNLDLHNVNSYYSCGDVTLTNVGDIAISNIWCCTGILNNKNGGGTIIQTNGNLNIADFEAWEHAGEGSGYTNDPIFIHGAGGGSIANIGQILHSHACPAAVTIENYGTLNIGTNGIDNRMTASNYRPQGSIILRNIGAGGCSVLGPLQNFALTNYSYGEGDIIITNIAGNVSIQNVDTHDCPWGPIGSATYIAGGAINISAAGSITAWNLTTYFGDTTAGANGANAGNITISSISGNVTVGNLDTRNANNNASYSLAGNATLTAGGNLTITGGVTLAAAYGATKSGVLLLTTATGSGGSVYINAAGTNFDLSLMQSANFNSDSKNSYLAGVLTNFATAYTGGSGTLASPYLTSQTALRVVTNQFLFYSYTAGGINGYLGGSVYRVANTNAAVSGGGLLCPLSLALPSITTGAYDHVTASAAYLYGTLSSTGLAPATVYAYWWTNNGTVLSANLQTVSAGIVTNQVSGLAPGTLYYYTFMASNAFGTAWAPGTNTFSTMAPPAITNVGAINVGSTNATLVGNLTSTGTAPTTVYCLYGVSNIPQSFATTATLSGAVVGQVPYTVSSGLTQNTAYAFTFMASNQYGVSWAPTTNWFTTMTLPTITNGGYDHVTASSAYLYGTLQSTGSAAATVCCYWGTNSVLENSTNLQTFSPGQVATNQASGLATNTTYYYTFMASNIYGATWASTTNSFRTMALPAIANTAASNVTATNAMLGAFLSSTGSAAATVYWFWWTGSITNNGAQSVAGTGDVSQTVTGLTSSAFYHYTFMASNQYGVTWAAPALSFTTLASSQTTPPNLGAPVASPVGPYTVTLSDELISDGGATTTVYCSWGTNTAALENSVNFGIQAAGTVTTNLAGLNHSTWYSFAFMASNSVGTTNTITSTFRTLHLPPTISNNTATALSSASASLRATLWDLGGAGTNQVWAYWGTTAGSWTGSSNLPDATATGAVSLTISGLNSNAVYYYTFMASNADVTGWAPTTNSFALLPAIAGGTASNVQTSSATVWGTLLCTGGVPTRVFAVYGTSAGSLTATNDAGIWTAGPVSAALTGLNPNSSCYFTFLATNAAGAAWASQTNSFALLPALGAPATGTVTASSAQMIGSLLSTGGAPVTVWSYWGTNAATWNNLSLGVLAPGSVTNTVSGLLTNTTYVYAFMASNSAGVAWSVTNQFQTLATLPAIANTGVSNLTHNTATLCGNLTTNGNTPTTVYCYWGTNAGALTFVSNLGVRGIGALSNTVIGLAQNTPYYYQYLASNSVGTASAAAIPFTTPASFLTLMNDENVDDGVLTGTNSAGAVENILTNRANGSFWWADENGDGTMQPAAAGLNLAGHNLTCFTNAGGLTLNLNDGTANGSITNGGRITTAAAPSGSTGPIVITNAAAVQLSVIDTHHTGVYQSGAIQLFVGPGDIVVNSLVAGLGNNTTAGITVQQRGNLTIGTITNTTGALSGYATGNTSLTGGGQTYPGICSIGAIVAYAAKAGNVTIQNYQAVTIGGGIDTHGLPYTTGDSHFPGDIFIANIGSGGVTIAGNVLAMYGNLGYGRDANGLVITNVLGAVSVMGNVDTSRSNTISTARTGGVTISATGSVSVAAINCSINILNGTSYAPAGSVSIASLTGTVTVGTISATNSLGNYVGCGGGTVSIQSAGDLAVTGTISLASLRTAETGVLALKTTGAGSKITVQDLDCLQFRGAANTNTFDAAGGASYINGTLANFDTTTTGGSGTLASPYVTSQSVLRVPAGQRLYYKYTPGVLNDSLGGRVYQVADLNGNAGTGGLLCPSVYVANVNATNITATTANLVGNLAAGTGTVTVTCYWGTNPTSWASNTSWSVSALGNVTNSVGSLTPGQTYYFRYFASNSAAQVWAPTTNSFTTMALPSVTTGGYDHVTASSATLYGTLINTGSAAATVWCYWGTNSVLENNANLLKQNPGTVTNQVSGLATNTTYYYTFMASNAWGVSWAPGTNTFTTMALPAITVGAYDSVTLSGARLFGMLTSTGSAATTVYCYWWTNGGAILSASQSSNPGTVTNLVGGLAQNTAYSYTFMASNVYGATWAAGTNAFTTMALPVIANTIASGVTGTNATLNGTLSSTGSAPATVYCFWWKPGFTSNSASQSVSGPVPGSVSQDVSNLTQGATYHFTFMASNAWGVAWASPDGIFTTLQAAATAPDITPLAATSAGPYGATLGASLSSTGGAPTTVWCYWGTNTAALENSADLGIQAAGTVTTNVVGLSHSTWYSFAFMASNSAGTTSTATNQFRTLHLAPTVSNNTATALSPMSDTLRATLWDLGGDLTNRVWAFWGTTAGSWTGTTNLPDATTTGVVNVTVSGLNSNASYYYTFMASNTDVAGWAATTNSFALLPAITAGAVSNVQASSATVCGTLLSTGGAPVRVFAVYGTSAANLTQTNDAGIWAAGPVSATLTNLNPNSSYYFTFMATNSAGVAWAAQTNAFALLPALGAPTTGTVTASSAQLIIPLLSTGGAPVTVWSYWGTNVATWTGVSLGVQAAGAVTNTVFGLWTNTPHFYAFMASNSAGVAWSVTNQFQTLATLPAIVNTGVSNLTHNSAIVCGNLTTNGNTPTTVYCYWGTNAGTWTYVNNVGVKTTGMVSNIVSGLAQNTTYYYQYLASNAMGTAWAPVNTAFTTPISCLTLTNDENVDDGVLTGTNSAGVFENVRTNQGNGSFWWADMNGDGTMLPAAAGLNMASHNLTCITNVGGITLNLNDGTSNGSITNGGKITTVSAPTGYTGPIVITNAASVQLSAIDTHNTGSYQSGAIQLFVGPGDIAVNSIVAGLGSGNTAGITVQHRGNLTVGTITNIAGTGSSYSSGNTTLAGGGQTYPGVCNIGAIVANAPQAGNVTIQNYQTVIIGGGGIDTHGLPYISAGSHFPGDIFISNIGSGGVTIAGNVIATYPNLGHGKDANGLVITNVLGTVTVLGSIDTSRSNTISATRTGGVTISATGSVSLAGINCSINTLNGSIYLSAGSVSLASLTGTVTVGAIAATNSLGNFVGCGGGSVSVQSAGDLAVTGTISLASLRTAETGVLALKTTGAGSKITVQDLDCLQFRGASNTNTFDAAGGASYINGTLANFDTTTTAGSGTPGSPYLTTQTVLRVPAGQSLYYKYTAGVLNDTLGGHTYRVADLNGNAGQGGVLTVAGAPEIASVGVANLLPTSADLLGNLTTGSVPVTVTCYWGTNDGANVTAAWMTNNSWTVSTLGLVTNSQSGLVSGRTYFYRYYVSNGNGAVWATNSVTFTTPGAPAIATVGAANVLTTSANLIGNLTTGLAPITVVCYWGTNDGANVTAAWMANTSWSASTLGPVTNSLSSLTPAQTYFFRYYASNASGSFWATNSATFTTFGVPAVNNAGGAVNAWQHGVRLNGAVLTGNPIPQVSIYWGTADGGTVTNAWNKGALALGTTGWGAFSTNVAASLLVNSQYWYRCYATNAYGSAWAPSSTSFTVRLSALSLMNNEDLGDGVLTASNSVGGVENIHTNAANATLFWWADENGDGTMLSASVGLNMNGYNLTRITDSVGITLNLNDGAANGAITNGGTITTARSTNTPRAPGSITITNAARVQLNTIDTRNLLANYDSGNILLANVGDVVVSNLYTCTGFPAGAMGGITVLQTGSLTVSDVQNLGTGAAGNTVLPVWFNGNNGSGTCTIGRILHAAATVSDVTIENYRAVTVGTNGIDARCLYGDAGAGKPANVSIRNIGPGGVVVAGDILANHVAGCGTFTQTGVMITNIAGSVSVGNIDAHGSDWNTPNWDNVTIGAITINAGGNVSAGNLNANYGGTVSAGENAGNLTVVSSTGSVNVGGLDARQACTNAISYAGSATVTAFGNIAVTGSISLAAAYTNNTGLLTLKTTGPGSTIAVQDLDCLQFLVSGSASTFDAAGGVIAVNGTLANLDTPACTRLRVPAGQTVYYSTLVPGNAYLGGATYTLAGGGILRPVILLSIANVWAANVNAVAGTADLVGNLTTGAAPITVTCYWGTNDGGTNASAWLTNAAQSVSTPGNLTTSVTNLLANTTYYFRFFASNSVATAWAPNSLMFSLQTTLAVDNGMGAVSLSPSSERLSGTVLGGSPNPNVWLYWGTSDGGTNKGSWNLTPIGLGVRGSGAFTYDQGGLLANGSYWYRCYASNVNSEAWATASSNFTAASPALTLSPTNTGIVEGALGTTSPVTFTVSLSATSAVAVSVNFATANGTATASDNDYAPTNGTLTIPAGNLAGQIQVKVLGDNKYEPDEVFYLNLANLVGATSAAPLTASCTITNDDWTWYVRGDGQGSDANNGSDWSHAFATIQVALTNIPGSALYRTSIATSVPRRICVQASTGTQTYAAAALNLAQALDLDIEGGWMNVDTTPGQTGTSVVSGNNVTAGLGIYGATHYEWRRIVVNRFAFTNVTLGVTVSNNASIDDADVYVTVSNTTISAQSHGIYLYYPKAFPVGNFGGTAQVTAVNVDIKAGLGATGDAIHVEGAWMGTSVSASGLDPVTGAPRVSTLTSSNGSGVYLTCPNNNDTCSATFANTLIYGCASNGVHLDVASSGYDGNTPYRAQATLTHCTIADNHANGLDMPSQTNGSWAAITNCVFSGNAGAAVSLSSTNSAFTCQENYNVFFGATGLMVNGASQAVAANSSTSSPVFYGRMATPTPWYMLNSKRSPAYLGGSDGLNQGAYQGVMLPPGVVYSFR